MQGWIELLGVSTLLGLFILREAITTFPKTFFSPLHLAGGVLLLPAIIFFIFKAIKNKK